MIKQRDRRKTFPLFAVDATVVALRDRPGGNLRGVVLERVHGADRRWAHAKWYYLVKPDGGFKAHWFVEFELAGVYQKTRDL